MAALAPGAFRLMADMIAPRMSDAPPPATSRDVACGGAWLIAQMSLTIRALSRVKRLGAGYPATQVCVPRAQYPSSAGVLSVPSHPSQVLSAGVGYLVVDDVPRAGFTLGAANIVAAAL